MRFWFTFGLLLICTFCNHLFAQNAPKIKFSGLYGSGKNDVLRCLIATSDGGFLLGGSARGNSGLVSGITDSVRQSGDWWFVKVDVAGKVLWSRALPGSANAWTVRMLEIDNYYVAAGYGMAAPGYFVATPAGGAALVYFDKATGAVLPPVFPAPTSAYSIDDLISAGPGRGLFVVGYNSPNANDLWLARIDSARRTVWQKNFGSSKLDAGHSVCLTKRNSLLITGYSNGRDGDLTGCTSGECMLVLYTDTLGKKLASIVADGSKYGRPFSAWESDGGNPVVAGQLFAWTTPPGTGASGSGFHGSDEIVVTKFNRSTGSVVWSRCYGGSNMEHLRNAVKTQDNGAVLIGDSYSTDGDLDTSSTTGRTWVVRIDSNGTILWQRSFGNSGRSTAGQIATVCGNMYAFGATALTPSAGGDVKGTGYGGADMWLCLLGEDGLKTKECPKPGTGLGTGAPAERPFALRMYPHPATDQVIIEWLDAGGPHEILIHDFMGRLVQHSPAPAGTAQMTLNVTGWARGTYFVRLISGGELATSRLMLQ